MADILDINLDDAVVGVVLGPAVNAKCRGMLEAVGAEHIALIPRHLTVLSTMREESSLEHRLEPRRRERLLHSVEQLLPTYQLR